MGRALIVRIGVGGRFKKPATKLSRTSSAWPTLVALGPSERPQLLLDALRKSLRHKDLALILRDPKDDVFRVQAVCGYRGKDFSSMQLNQDSPLMRHFVAHPVTTRYDQLERLPWFKFLPMPEQEAMAELEAGVIEPLSTETGLAGILVLGQRRPKRSMGAERMQWRGALLSRADRIRLATIIEGWWLRHQLRKEQQSPTVTAQAPRQADQLTHLEQTTRGLAHDLNNILTIIISHAQLLEDEEPGSEAKGHAAAIREAGLYGAQSVLRMRGLQGRPADLDLRRVEVNEIIRSTLQMIDPRWRQGRISYPSGLGDYGFLRLASGTTAAHGGTKGPPPALVVTLRPAGYIFGSAMELRRVLTNIVSNAVDALPSEDGRIVIDSRQDGERAIINIKDNGAGIPPSNMRRIFEPYFTTKGRSGRGLGLSISQGILARHGGTLEVESREGRGSTFTILLPLTKLEDRL